MTQVRGFFWRVDAPDEKLSGILTLDEEAGPRLEVDGSFEPLSASMAGGARYPALHGSTHDGDITLFDCMQAGLSMRLPGYARQSLWVHEAVVGGLIEPDEVFDELDLECDHLADWHRRSGLRIEDLPFAAVEKWRAAYIWPDELVAELPDGSTVGLAFGHSRSEALGRLEVVERSSLVVRSSRPGRPRELFSQHGAILRDLVTFATLTPSVLTKVAVRSSGHARQLLEGKEHRIDLELRGRFVQPALQQRVAETVHPIKQLFLPEDHPGGFPRVVPAWVDLYARAKEALDLHLGSAYQPAFWFPSRVATAAQALEAYHRLILPQPRGDSAAVRRVKDILNACPEQHRDWLKPRLAHAHEPSLQKRLRELVKRVKALAKPVFDASEGFVNDLSDARNLYAHPGDRSRPVAVDVERLYSVYLQARWLLLANVLVDLGFPHDRVAMLLHRNQEFSDLSARLGTSEYL